MTKQEWTKVEVEAGEGNTELWDFTKNKELVGTLKEMKTNIGPNSSTLGIVETEDGDYSFWVNSVLQTRLQKVEIGAEVKIIFLGKVKSPKSGRMYNNYEVFFRKI